MSKQQEILKEDIFLTTRVKLNLVLSRKYSQYKILQYYVTPYVSNYKGKPWLRAKVYGKLAKNGLWETKRFYFHPQEDRWKQS